MPLCVQRLNGGQSRPLGSVLIELMGIISAHWGWDKMAATVQNFQVNFIALKILYSFSNFTEICSWCTNRLHSVVEWRNTWHSSIEDYDSTMQMLWSMTLHLNPFRKTRISWHILHQSCLFYLSRDTTSQLRPLWRDLLGRGEKYLCFFKAHRHPNLLSFFCLWSFYILFTITIKSKLFTLCINGNLISVWMICSMSYNSQRS